MVILLQMKRVGKRMFFYNSLTMVALLTMLGLWINYSSLSNFTDIIIQDGANYEVSRTSYFDTEEYRINRLKEYNDDLFDSWFDNNTARYQLLRPDADQNGTILDFAISAFPKCGTTTMSSNLAELAPMDTGDVCTPAAQTVFYSYKMWPKQFGNGDNNNKTFRGSKCPMFINGIVEYSVHLPRTKLIIGVRHPISWFISFWNMQLRNSGTVAGGDPYRLTKPCYGKGCRAHCPDRQLFCVHRSRFHVDLAQLGKTDLTTEERSLLAPNDRDGGINLKNKKIRNPIFIYELKQIKEDYLWKSLGDYLGFEGGVIKHNKIRGAHGKQVNSTNFCEPKFDDLRATMMPYAYDLSEWLQRYLIPVAKNTSRLDVVIAHPDSFVELVESYKYDPCKRLARSVNGTFVVAIQNITLA